MPGTSLFLAGDSEGVDALESALSERGIATRSAAVSGMTAALVEQEQTLENQRPAAVVSVGTGESALALAITAGKLGIPLIACLGEPDGDADGAKHRILKTLATLQADANPERAAGVIAAWLQGESSARDLD